MAKKKIEVRVHDRSLRLEVVIPKEYVWEFMAEFGKAFAEESDGVSRNRAVDDYEEYSSGWHIMITLSDRDEVAFHDFLRSFSQQRDLPFREPGQNICDILAILWDLKARAEKLPVPMFLKVLPYKPRVDDLVEAAQELQLLYQIHESHRLAGKYQKKD
jgi:hypothetical protein